MRNKTNQSTPRAGVRWLALGFDFDLKGYWQRSGCFYKRRMRGWLQLNSYLILRWIDKFMLYLN